MLPINQNAIYIIDENNPHAVSLMKRLAEIQPKPGAIIPVTSEEFECFANGGISIKDIPLERAKNQCPSCSGPMRAIESGLDMSNMRHYELKKCGECGHENKEF